MQYFRTLQELLAIEKESDRRTFEELTHAMRVSDRRDNGMAWYPVAIRETELGRGDYLTVELERTTHLELAHQFRSGMSVSFFSNHDARNDRMDGIVTHISGSRMRVALKVDELPDWTRNGKLGVDAVFDENSYQEMERALRQAAAINDKFNEGRLVRILTAQQQPTSTHDENTRNILASLGGKLNPSQLEAVEKILSADDIAVVHGPPGTGKTTTLVQAIKALIQQNPKKLLVVAPSNAAVDLISERLAEEGLQVVRIGNPARVNERQQALTLDERVANHPGSREIKKLKKQVAQFLDMAHTYKRSFGASERAQRNALFTEARNIRKQIERNELYILDDILSAAQVVTATLVGAAHQTISNIEFHIAVIDEAGQALEPACWIPILRARKLVMAGDHNQLAPTVKSIEAEKKGLSTTLMEKVVSMYPSSVVLLKQQYRMNEVIAGFSSQEFYSGLLEADSSVAHQVLFTGDQPFLFIDTAGAGYEEIREGNKISNPEEAAFTVKHLVTLAEQLKEYYTTDDFPTIGLISPYRQQVEVLRQSVAQIPKLASLGSRLTVSTIDSFQGQERDIIYISLTRSNADASIGFLSEVRRMNVAMTRARKKLVMVGDSATLAGSGFYEDLIGYADRHGSYISAWDLL